MYITFFMSPMGYIMDFSSMSDLEIERELGRRIKSLRLRRNMTQQSVADAACIGRKSVSALENGSGGTMLSTMIAIMRELGALDGLDTFLPEPSVSPIELAKREGKRRKRASGSVESGATGGESEW